MTQRRQRLYIHVVRLFGAAILIDAFVTPDFRNFQTFAVYLGAAILLSILKIKLPGLTSSVSLNTIPLLVGIAELSPTESVVIGFAGTLVQSFWHAKKRPGWVRLSFNLSVIVIAIDSSGAVFRNVHAMPHAGTAAAFAALALTFFTMDTLPVCTAIALTEQQSLVEVWREMYASSFHLFMMGAAVAGIITMSGGPKWIVCLAILPLFFLVFRAFWMFLARLQEEKSHAAESASLNLRTIEALVAVIQARDGSNDDHLVQKYAVEIAKVLRLPDEEMKALAAAALLRDIGKMAIPDHVLCKPGHLTPAEMERVQKHVTIGADILEGVNFPFPVVPIVRAHHEKWDGTGYPDGLRGEEIPLGARILAAVDSLLSMTSERPYRRALSLDEAMGVIVSEANQSFDPAVVATLESYTDELRSALQPEEEPKEPSRELRGLPQFPQSTPEEIAENPLQSITLARREDQVLAGTDAFLNLKESLSVFALRLSRVLAYDTFAVYVQAGDRLVPEYVSGDESKVLASGALPVGAGLVGTVLETGKAVLNGDPARDFRILNYAYRTKLHSALAVPIESALGRRGVLTLYSSRKNAFTSENLRVMLAVRLKVLDWELHSLASSALLSNLSIAAHDESAETSFSSA